jgi:adenosine deaminase
MNNGIIALGLGGPEIDNPPEIFREVFKHTESAGLPSLAHAGETEGPPSIWGAINMLSAVRIGHGIRCLEDPELVRYLNQKQIPLEVCPTSNVCLGVVRTLEEHPLPKLLEEGLFVTINSDDPPMFDTTLTEEYLRIVKTFNFDISLVQQFVINGIRASLLSLKSRMALENEFREQFVALESESEI